MAVVLLALWLHAGGLHRAGNTDLFHEHMAGALARVEHLERLAPLRRRVR